jgi:ADP-ribose pyrophosphatase YjhB (NUDIX family)
MAHIHEKVDFTVEVFVVYKDKVLLRKHDKYGIWLSVGGHIELHEDPNEAAVREVKEEVGLNVALYHDGAYPLTERDGYKTIIPPRFMNKHRIKPSHEHVTLVYFATSDTDNLVLSETEKSPACRWFTLPELGNPRYALKEDIKMYARSALETLCDHK